MKNPLIIGSMVLAVAVVIGGFLLFKIATLSPTTTPPPATGGISNTTNPPGSTNVPPSGNNQGGTTTTQPPLTVVGVSDSQVLVKDFKKDTSTVTSPNLPGHYFLAGGLNPSATHAPYSIMYVDADQSFNISLWTEPIGDVRKQAEQDLLNRLGIGEQDACFLRYSVLVPYSVSPLYSGKNLGFSFCPGATQL
jgi:hypothetical protein